MTDFLFHEINGIYFAIVKEILNQKQALSTKELDRIVRMKGFDESVMQLLPSLQNKNNPWYLLFEKEPDCWFPITKNETPSTYTILERRWLKTIMKDPRLSFFLEDHEISDLNQQLKGIQPLFDLNAITYYDQFNQIDSIIDQKQQQRHFKCLIEAIQEKRPLLIDYQRHKKVSSKIGLFLPFKLDYSPKNNLFRLKAWRILRTSRFEVTLNLDRMLTVQLAEEKRDYLALPITSRRKQAQMTCQLIDKRQALKRSMLHFADYHKTTRRLDESHYELTIQYDTSDETELLIRILSFGPFLTVTSPDNFIIKIKERIEAQAKLMESFDQ
ncbi:MULTISPECIES: WYL domain-containing protein [unclassified Enterococcus]|uniref:WYL domain-containing protein n=1 Tax=unclassified Enterococcus TaxID=2608891 RepID=UPI001CE08524|nr:MULTISPECIES: WYL domain-containing protein [unclassified Enterococcus]MCA5013033.1 WYL domain-containing protein [Enterococcus sp. S23]MCA5016283.1 WYL domain-containing protein [Enterococcus sp. S22(2020)]